MKDSDSDYEDEEFYEDEEVGLPKQILEAGEKLTFGK